MAPSDALAPVAMTSADVLAGVALSDGAGWNQTADDWQLFVEHGRAIGWRTAQSQLVASAATLPYGGVAWISMVLVDRQFQHRGLATALLERCVGQLVQDSVVPVLDATPAGEPVYRRLGFEPGFALARWEAELPAAKGVHTGEARVRAAGLQDLDAIAALDTEAAGLDRRFLLRDFLARHGSMAWLLHDDAGKASGFAIVRRGRRALQIGPLVAPSLSQAVVLLDAALARIAGRVFLDVPSHWQGLAEALSARGFRVQRPFVRMALAPSLPPCVAQAGEHLFVLAGPEFG
ncbi:putative acetyltransferase involved in intracellular survival [Variovorax sp. PBL-H6]|uniref:GNAT family N-acetyltransferase n=1 Tax=Variovorax sp. PBL-H6 TaxID=434009 RepID=UPI0013171135|nr:GNAT family N-acetyltransferase [Variovorax sp. PBL-H6]VTU37148.1 putative acetyltransferase involved in intracellular survival [Variovorax sp. PBL-H6]